MKNVNIAVLGATGYTGVELVRLLLLHPEVSITFVSSESQAGQKLSRVHPQLSGMTDMTLSALDPEKIPADVDVVFCALPHGSSAEVALRLKERGLRVIDLSADFRLQEPSLYQEWYGHTHPFPGSLKDAVYGLPEINAERVKSAELVANPGCYPTSVLLALLPLAEKGLLPAQGILADSKSGVSGAGRAPRQGFHFPECSESFKAYRVASHQHTPEMEQGLSVMQGSDVKLLFTPHLLPINRGILSTCYVPFSGTGMKEEEVREIYRGRYRHLPFVTMLEEDVLPETRWVRGTNLCHLNLCLDERTGNLVVVSAIDNLVKGAAGQAVQNMNLMLGYPETRGLEYSALIP